MTFPRGGLTLKQADLLRHIANPTEIPMPADVKPASWRALLDRSLIRYQDIDPPWVATAAGLAWLRAHR